MMKLRVCFFSTWPTELTSHFIKSLWNCIMEKTGELSVVEDLILNFVYICLSNSNVFHACIFVCFKIDSGFVTKICCARKKTA